jgi:hypothetical protein
MFVWVQIANAAVGNLQIYKGAATIQRADKKETARTGFPVRLKDTITISPSSTVAIVLKDSSVVRLEAGSEVEVGDITYHEGKIKNASFRLKLGRLWSRVAPLDTNGSFEVETPTVTAAVRGTNFNTAYTDIHTQVYVYRHSVQVAVSSGHAQTVPEGKVLDMQNAKLDADLQKAAVTPDAAFFDAWILFNQAEDDKICREHPATPGCRDYFVKKVSSPTPSPTLTATPSAAPTVFQKIFPTAIPTRIPTPTQTIRLQPSPTPTLKPTLPLSQPPTPTATKTPLPTLRIRPTFILISTPTPTPYIIY